MVETQRALADDIADALISGILSGRYRPGSALPSEVELSSQLGVSRLTLREAIRELRAARAVRVQRGRGMFVNPMSRWSVLAPRLLAARIGSEANLYRMLLEARAVVEVGACELATSRCTEDDVSGLEAAVQAMRDCGNNVEAFVSADLRFRAVIMAASANVFIADVFYQVAKLLAEGRRRTSLHAPIRRHAIDHHRRIIVAIRGGRPLEAADAMRKHMSQTANDFERYAVREHLVMLRGGSSA